MKMLLTSGGLATPELQQALLDLAGKASADQSVAFIPTAANVEIGDKRWLIKDLQQLNEAGYKTIDVVDISALPKELWLDRLARADIIMVGGGNTYHLMHWVKTSGLASEIQNLLQSRVYVGISAGSMIVGTAFITWKDEALAADGLAEATGNAGLGLVDLTVQPHFNNPHFENVTKKETEDFAKENEQRVYLLDDSSAVVVVDEKIAVIGKEHYVF